MLPEWAGALAAKAKVAAVMTAAVAAGGVGGTVALSHVSPTTQQVVESASTASADPETGQAGEPTTDPETGQAGEPTTDPETGDAQDPETGDAGGSGSGAAGDCPDDVANHGDHVSSVAHSAPHGAGGVHGKAVSEAAHSDCGKKAHSDDPETAHAGGGSDDQESSDAHGGKHSTHRTGPAAPAGDGAKHPARHQTTGSAGKSTTKGKVDAGVGGSPTRAPHQKQGHGHSH